VTATNATSVVISNNVDSTSYTLSAIGGMQTVTPTTTTIYKATATGTGGTAIATVTVSIGVGSVQSVNHVLFMMQENRSFDSYFGMLNNYRKMNKWNIADDLNEYDIDGTDDKLATRETLIKFSAFHSVIV
jgi:phospholipase C